MTTIASKPQRNAAAGQKSIVKLDGTLSDGTYYKHVEVENSEAKYGILLLHGAAFSSQTWEDLGTIGKPFIYIQYARSLFVHRSSHFLESVISSRP